MRSLPVLLLAAMLAHSSGFSLLHAQDAKAALGASIDARRSEYIAVANRIWSLAEVGYQEKQSSALLQDELRRAGFTVQAGVAGIPTAFVASYGSGKPVIGVIAEFDALPGLSQAAVPRRQPVAGLAAGHACGHHLFGTASVAAGIAVKEWMAPDRSAWHDSSFGTPAEEGGGGKVYMVRAGLFDDVDAALDWHPGDPRTTPGPVRHSPTSPGSSVFAACRPTRPAPRGAAARRSMPSRR